MVKYIQIGKLYFYISDRKLKAKSGQTRNKAERRLKHLQVVRTILQTGKTQCELCGAETELQMHHLFAQSIWPEKALDQNNTMLVCCSCHQRIHNDPFLWCDLIKKRLPDVVQKVDAVVGNPPYEIKKPGEPGAPITESEG